MLLYRNINNQGNYFNIRRSPMLNLMDLKSLYSGLPDDRPITSIGVIEDSDKCPPDYYVVRHWKHLFFIFAVLRAQQRLKKNILLRRAAKTHKRSALFV